MITRARQIEIEKAIVELLEEYDLGTYPISIGKVSEALQVNLIPYSGLSNREKTLADLASRDKSFNITSFDYMYAQVVFDDIPGSYFCRSRFSGGHEIAHIWLEHEENTPNREDEANYFSGYLLAPHPLIITTKTLNNTSEISKCFAVSRDCASFAIDQANARKCEGGFWKPHEKWLIENIKWKGGDLFGRA